VVFKECILLCVSTIYEFSVFLSNTIHQITRLHSTVHNWVYWFKPTIGNESLHEISNDNGVRIVNFPTSKNLTVKSTMFPHRNIHKFTWTSPDGKTWNDAQPNWPYFDR
jgi:hypothetical protein